MSLPLSCIDLRLKKISSINELAEITFGIISALERAFKLKRNWQQIAPADFTPDAHGLAPLEIKNESDLVRFFINRGWGQRFSRAQHTGTGIFYNETVIVQTDPQEFSIIFEHTGAEELGEWRITIDARERKLNRNLLLKCVRQIYKQNEIRIGSIHCSYKTPQIQIGKYMPRPLIEEIFVYNIGETEILT